MLTRWKLFQWFDIFSCVQVKNKQMNIKYTKQNCVAYTPVDKILIYM